MRVLLVRGRADGVGQKLSRRSTLPPGGHLSTRPAVSLSLVVGAVSPRVQRWEARHPPPALVGELPPATEMEGADAAVVWWERVLWYGKSGWGGAVRLSWGSGGLYSGPAARLQAALAAAHPLDAAGDAVLARRCACLHRCMGSRARLLPSLLRTLAGACFAAVGWDGAHSLTIAPAPACAQATPRSHPAGLCCVLPSGCTPQGSSSHGIL
jgi:hypothetical protein